MNITLSVSLRNGSTQNIQSQYIVYMGPSRNGVYTLAYMADERLAQIEITDLPSSLENKVSYLAEISNNIFSLINSNYISSTVDNGSNQRIKYQIPNGRLVDLGTVEMTLNSLHTEMSKSTIKSQLEALIAANTNITTGLDNVDNTSDINKPISSAVQTALDGKTTETYVDTQITNVIASAPGALDTLNELAAALGDDADLAGTMTTSLAGKVDDSQVLTNVPSGALFTDTNTTYSVGDGGLSQINFTSADNTKLDGIETGATADQTASQITALGIAATSVTGSQASAITANTSKVTNATHTGDVTGDTVLTIATDAVDIAMLSATGTASATTFLRGDNTWVNPGGGVDGGLQTDDGLVLGGTLKSITDGSSNATGLKLGTGTSIEVTKRISQTGLGNSTLFGEDAGLNDNGATKYNSAYGYNSLRGTTSGNNNTATGMDSLRYNTTGSDSSAFGRGALRNSITATANSAFGKYAMMNTVSNYNTAFGSTSLYANTTGTNNVSQGESSMRNSTTGSDNVAIGKNAIYNGTTGSSNVALGSSALYNNQGGASNVAIGVSANSQRANNVSNIAIGPWSLQGSNNLNWAVGIGGNALRGSNVGHYSVGIGDSAGRNSSGNGCVFLGYQAGYGSTVANSLFIANTNTSTPLIHGNFGTSELTINGELTVDSRKMKLSGATVGASDGDVVYFGGTTGMTIGTLYHYKSDGTWEPTNANAVATCDGLLGVALGAASDTNGMLLRGMVTLSHDPGAIGDVLFLSAATNGLTTATAPTGSADIVRVIGYQVNHASQGEIWFNPDSTYVELA